MTSRWAPHSHQGSRPLLVFHFSVLVEQAVISTVTSWPGMSAGLCLSRLHGQLGGGRWGGSRGVHPRSQPTVISLPSSPHNPFFYVLLGRTQSHYHTQCWGWRWGSWAGGNLFWAAM